MQTISPVEDFGASSFCWCAPFRCLQRLKHTALRHGWRNAHWSDDGKWDSDGLGRRWRCRSQSAAAASTTPLRTAHGIAAKIIELLNSSQHSAAVLLLTRNITNINAKHRGTQRTNKTFKSTGSLSLIVRRRAYVLLPTEWRSRSSARC